MDEFLPGAVVELRAEYVRFLERHILPVVAECEREGRFPREAIRAVGEAGWFGALFPESLGGSDLGFLVAAVLAEDCLLYTSPSPRDQRGSRMPSSA